jgi:hypothetical protein
VVRGFKPRAIKERLVRIPAVYTGLCPVCLSATVPPSRPRLYEYPLRVLRLHPYRCLTCRTRFWSFDPGVKALLWVVLWVSVVTVAAGLIWLVLAWLT